jgi:hypothetical protein
MALRQAGGGAARLLLLRPAASGLQPAGAAFAAGAGAGAGAGAAPLSGLSALALHAASLHLDARHRGPGLLLPPPSLLLGLAPLPLAPWAGAAALAGARRGLQAPSERKEDAAAKALPDAQECDEAIEKYREVRLGRPRSPGRGALRPRTARFWGRGWARGCGGAAAPFCPEEGSPDLKQD